MFEWTPLTIIIAIVIFIAVMVCFAIGLRKELK
jgi:hypothetical protein